MALIDDQIKAIKEIYLELEKHKTKIMPIITGKFALSVYTQGMYPSNIISFLYPDIPLLQKVLKDLGFKHEVGDIWTRDNVVVEISKNFEILPTGMFNQIEAEGKIINVISLEDLLIDMMSECIEGDDIVCDLIKMIIKSYRDNINFHYIFQNLKDKRAVIKFKQFKDS